MQVLVFKTSVSERTQVGKVQALLDRIPAITRWNFDLEDCDNILRIVTGPLCARKVESLLQKAGFDCQELV